MCTPIVAAAERRPCRANECFSRRWRRSGLLRVAHADERSARPHAHACAPDLHRDRVLPRELSVGREGVRIRLVSDHVVVTHVVADPAQALGKVIRVHDGEAPCLFGEVRRDSPGRRGALAGAPWRSGRPPQSCSGRSECRLTPAIRRSGARYNRSHRAPLPTWPPDRTRGREHRACAGSVSWRPSDAKITVFRPGRSRAACTMRLRAAS